MNRIVFLLIAVVVLAATLTCIIPAFGQANGAASPIYGIRIPAAHRDWRLTAADNLLVEDKTGQLRVQLGNDIAINAFKEGRVPFPDGAIIAAIRWTRVPSETNNKVLK